MRVAGLGFAAMAALWPAPAVAEDELFEPLPLLDLTQVDPQFAEDMFGQWAIRDESGAASCLVELKREATVGGRQIKVDPACAMPFPIMAEIKAWRLLEGWAIDLTDAEQRTLIRFSTPDERYVAFPEVDGIVTIEPVPLD